MSWDLSALDRFINKIDKITEDAGIYALEGTSKNFASDIENYYPSSIVSISSVDKSNDGIDTVINVYDDDLWFKEFGTGFDGIDSGYVNNLPKTPLNFISRGEPQSTNGWKWAYHPDTRKNGGWWYLDRDTGKLEFTTGQPAQMGFAKSVNKLKAQGVPQLADYIAMKLKG